MNAKPVIIVGTIPRVRRWNEDVKAVRTTNRPNMKGFGGDGGIRTPDKGLRPYNGLANRRLQPLGHVSSCARRLIHAANPDFNPRRTATAHAGFHAVCSRGVPRTGSLASRFAIACSSGVRWFGWCPVTTGEPWPTTGLTQRRLQPALVIAWSSPRRIHRAATREAHIRGEPQPQCQLRRDCRKFASARYGRCRTIEVDMADAGSRAIVVKIGGSGETPPRRMRRTGRARGLRRVCEVNLRLYGVKGGLATTRPGREHDRPSCGGAPGADDDPAGHRRLCHRRLRPAQPRLAHLAPSKLGRGCCRYSNIQVETLPSATSICPILQAGLWSAAFEILANQTGHVLSRRLGGDHAGCRPR